MADNWGAYFQARPNDNDWSAYFPNAISEAEANRTFTPEEQAKIDLANEPQFGAGTARRMAEYEGLSPTDAAAKYRSGWADTIGGVLDTISDSRKLASVAGDVVSAGAEAVSHPIDTANKIGNYYYENPDAAATDALFAAMPIKYGAKALERAGEAKALSPKAMPRGSVREGPELYKTGAGRMNEAKLSDVSVDPTEIRTSLGGFHKRLAEKAIRINPKLHPKSSEAFNQFIGLVRSKPPDEMSRLTKTKGTPPPKATMQVLHEVRQMAQDAAQDVYPGTRRPTPDAMLGTELLKTIDEVILKHPEGLKFAQGKNEVARGLRDKEIENAVDNAMQTALWNRGDKATAIRNAVRPLYKKYKNTWPKEDLDILRRLQKFGLFTDTLAGFASKGPGAQTFARGAELAVGLPPFAIWPIASVAKGSRNRRVEGLVDQLRAQIRAGGPVRN